MRYRSKVRFMIRCPYYDGESKLSIHCDGAWKECVHRFVFPSEIEKNCFLARHCACEEGKSGCEWQEFLAWKEAQKLVKSEE